MKLLLGVVAIAIALASSPADAQIKKDKFVAPNGVKLERTVDQFTGKTTYAAKDANWFDGEYAFDVRRMVVRILGRSEANRDNVKVYVEALHRGAPITVEQFQFRGGEAVAFRVAVPNVSCFSGFCYFTSASVIEIPEETLRRYAVDGQVEAQVTGSVGRPFKGKLDLRVLDALDAAQAL